MVHAQFREHGAHAGSAAVRAFVINLDVSVARLEAMREAFAAAGCEFERIAAVDGWAIPEAERFAAPPGRSPLALEPGEFGCLLSHREVWRRIAGGCARFGAVFEDDIRISPRLREALADDRWIPGDADIVKLETTLQPLVLDGAVNRPLSGVELRRLRSCHIGAAGYILSRVAAARLLSALADLRGPIDHDLFDPSHRLFDRLTTYQMTPALCVQRRLVDESGDEAFGESTIRRRVNDNKALRRSFLPRVPARAKLARELARPFWRMGAYLSSSWRLWTGERVALVAPFDASGSDSPPRAPGV